MKIDNLFIAKWQNNLFKFLQREEVIKICKVILLCLLMWINQWYMHYEVYISHYGIDNIYPSVLFWWLDVLVSVCFFYVCTLGRLKMAMVLSYVFLGVFVVANTIYSRFFEQYLSVGVLSETSNFHGTWWLQYVPMAFRWTDVLLLITTAIFVYVVRSLRQERNYKEGLCFGFITVLLISIYTVQNTRERQFSLCSYDQMKTWVETSFGERFKTLFMLQQEYMVVGYGVLLTQVYCNIEEYASNHELTDSEKNEISAYIRKNNASAGTLCDSCIVKGSPNIIFILVESYMSIASTTKVDGKEITPNLNALMKTKGTYSNVAVTSNRAVGESSDAQVSYFTGLIPLQSEMSVLRILKNKVIAFPKLLHDQKGYNTYITLPTGKYFWHQNEANMKYGIDNVIEVGSWAQDDEIFSKVEKLTPKLKKPFLNIILTLSMHGGYDEDYLESINIKSPFNYPSTYNKELCHYLNKCYFTDVQIGKYLDFLKKSGEYDKSVIVICSDHQTIPEEIKNESISQALPLIIANSHIPVDKFYQGPVNQIDLFPTLLDMFGLKSQWRGMGHSLLRKEYTNTITDEERQISNMILYGDYFANSLIYNKGE